MHAQPLFSAVIRTKGGVSWCTHRGVPPILIDNLRMARYVCDASLQAFCVLPDRVLLLVRPGKEGLRAFLDTFKTASVRDAQVVAGLLMADQQLFRGWLQEDEVQEVPPDDAVLARVAIEEAPLRFGLVHKKEKWQWGSWWYGSSFGDPTARSIGNKMP